VPQDRGRGDAVITEGREGVHSEQQRMLSRRAPDGERRRAPRDNPRGTCSPGEAMHRADAD